MYPTVYHPQSYLAVIWSDSMPQLHLTERSVRALEAPDPSGNQMLYWDDVLRGFGVLVSGTSTAKSFVAKGVINGRSIRKKIGRYGVYNVAQARIKATEMLRGFTGGIDPRQERSSNITLKEALEAYLRARGANLRPRSVAGYRSDIENYCADWLDVPLRNISRELVEGRHRAIAEEIAERRGRSGAAMANRVMRSLRTIYNFHADRIPNMPPNPVKLKGMWHPVAARERCLRGGEFPKFYKAAMALPNAVGRDFIILLIFTGLRRMEAAKLKWARVDLERKKFTIPPEDTKNGKKLELPMTDVVYGMLKARRAIGRTEYVFPSPGASGHLQEPKSFFNDIAAASGVRISPHDLRRTFLTVAETCDIPLLTLAALVNHTVPGVTPTYIQRDGVERLRKPAQKIATKLKELCGI
jgi:integrase